MTKKPKIGVKRYSAYVDGNRVEVDTHVLRTVRGRWGYMVVHIPGITWIKKSKKHGDWGYAKNVYPAYRRKFMWDRGLPYHPTKKAAVRALWSEVQQAVKDFGHDENIFLDPADGHVTFGEEAEIVRRKCVRMGILKKRSK